MHTDAPIQTRIDIADNSEERATPPERNREEKIKQKTTGRIESAAIKINEKEKQASGPKARGHGNSGFFNVCSLFSLVIIHTHSHTHTLSLSVSR